MIARNDVCYLQMILCYSTLLKMDPSIKLSTAFRMYALLQNENQHNKNGNYVPVQTTNAVLSPSWWSAIRTAREITKRLYLGVSLTSDSRQSSELDIRIVKAKAVMRQLHRFVVLKREFCTKEKLSIFILVYVFIRGVGSTFK